MFKVLLLFPLLLGAQPFPTEGGVKTYIWGEVKGPGVYTFPGSPDILELISQAGGPTEDADLKKIRIIRAEDGREEKVNLPRRMKKGELIFLKSGDVVIIPRSQMSRLMRIIPFIGAVATLINLYFTFQLSRR